MASATATTDTAKPEQVREGKRERTKRENRESILNAANEVFAEIGYGETTVRDIIRRTGLASGTFYNYFKSKEEVFEALSDRSALRVRPRLRAVRVRAASFEDFVKETFFTFFDYVKSDREYFDVMRRNTGAIRVRMDTPEIVAGFDELEADVKEAMARGLLPKMDAEYLTAAMVGVAFEIADTMIERDPIDPKAAAEFASGIFLNGLTGMKNDNT
ncbi:MAG: TetR/AcrR family transcriptional regulator [Alphaproteobacteria bacterium]